MFRVQLFPIYFGINAATVLLLLGTSSACGGALATPGAMRTLWVALASVLVNVFALEPMTTQNMFRRYALENANENGSEEYKKLRKAFGPLHGLSSLFNLVAMCCAVIHAHRLAGILAF